MSQPWLLPENANELSAWDACWVGGDLLPGITVCPTDCKRDLDIKKVAGKDSATMTDKGYSPATVKVITRVYTAEQWQDYQVILAKLHPRNKGGVREPQEIIHPEPNSKQVTEIYVQRIPPFEVALGKYITITLECVQWSAAPVEVRKGAGSGANTARGSPPTYREPLTPLEQSLDAYNANAQPPVVTKAVDKMWEDALYAPDPGDF